MDHLAPMNGNSINWTAQDWDEIVPRLMLVAVLRLARLASEGDRQGLPASFADAQDVVVQAVSQTISGLREWDQDDDTLYQHLARIVVGGISAKAGLSPSEGPGEGWRDERRQLLDHLYDKDERLGEMASLMLLENCCDTTELATALEVVPVEVTNLRRRMKHEVRDYIAGRPR